MQECIPQRWNAVFETSISLLSWRVVPQVRLDQQIATDSVLGRMNVSHTYAICYAGGFWRPAHAAGNEFFERPAVIADHFLL